MLGLEEMSWSSLLAKAVITGILYLITKYVYRVTFHPLAKFPGPPLAGMTSMFGMYYDLPMSTSYIKQFPGYHDKYGPIVRILPDQLHFRDMDAYNQVYKVGTKFNRSEQYEFVFTKGSMFNKLVVSEGKKHRELYVPYFSRANVNKMEHLIREHLALFLSKLQEACKSKEVVDLSLGFRCLTADTLMRYTYDKPFGALKAPGFRFPEIVELEEFFGNAAPGWYFPNFVNIMVSIAASFPRAWTQSQKPLAAALWILDGCGARIKELRKESEDKMTPSVFQTAFHPKVERGHPALTQSDLAADALVFFTAGTDTTAHAFVTATWRLMKNPDKLKKLQAALQEALPGTEGMPLDWNALEKIDYLRAVVKESIRLSYGVSAKLPRVTPPSGATLCNHFIPGGTKVSVSQYVYHQNPEFFPDPDEFVPERWIGSGAKGQSVEDAEKNFISFSRGSRNCIGQNLAYAELTYGIAYTMRRFEFDPAEEMRDEDMEWHDAFVVMTSGHLKVKVRSAGS